MHSLFKGNTLLLSEPTEGWSNFLETKVTADSSYPFCSAGPTFNKTGETLTGEMHLTSLLLELMKADPSDEDSLCVL